MSVFKKIYCGSNPHTDTTYINEGKSAINKI